MQKRLLISLLAGFSFLSVQAQDKPAAAEKTTVDKSATQGRIYKCGNEYTNTASAEQLKNCKLVTGGNVTIVPAQRPAPVAKASGAARTPADTAPRADATAQRERDNDARGILESELKKTESRLAEMKAEFNGGDPEKRGDESRNYQKYLDRVAELKANIARAESDIAGIKRELGRVPSGK